MEVLHLLTLNPKPYRKSHKATKGVSLEKVVILSCTCLYKGFLNQHNKSLEFRVSYNPILAE